MHSALAATLDGCRSYPLPIQTTLLLKECFELTARDCLNVKLFRVVMFDDLKKEGKAIPLQALTGPEGSRRLRLPDYKTIGS
jgi:hypothetical protein